MPPLIWSSEISQSFVLYWAERIRSSGIEQALLGLAHLDARQVAEQITLHGDLVILVRGDEVLLLELEQLHVVAISLPEIREIGLQRQFELFGPQPALSISIRALRCSRRRLPSKIVMPSVRPASGPSVRR